MMTLGTAGLLLDMMNMAIGHPRHVELGLAPHIKEVSIGGVTVL
jgi:hypothetical protein